MDIVGVYLLVVFGGWFVLLVVGAWGELREFQLKYAEVQLDKALLELSLSRRGELLMQVAGEWLEKEKELVAAQNKAAGLEVELYNIFKEFALAKEAALWWEGQCISSQQELAEQEKNRRG